MARTPKRPDPVTPTRSPGSAGGNPRTRAVEVKVRDAFGNEAPTTSEAPRKRGRPPSSAAAPRKTDRKPVRQDLRTGQILGRDGEVLMRRRLNDGQGSHISEFEIPEALRDPKWDLRAVRTSCHGKIDQANINEAYDQGWRPAMAKHYPGAFADLKGDQVIERDGLMLMERPIELTKEALDEQYREASELREIQAEAFGTRKLPKGFGKGRKSRDGRFDAEKKIERGEFYKAPANLKPQYEYASPGDDE